MGVHWRNQWMPIFNFMIQFEFVKFKYGYNPSGVYKMSFNTGHFYIGSSKHLKTRFCLWRTNLNRLDFSQKFILDILPLVTWVKFEVIEFVTPENILVAEGVYIKKFINDELLLNRRINPIDNTGVRDLPKHLKKYILTKEKKRKYPLGFKKKYYKPVEGWIPMNKPVKQYSLGMAFIKEHLSIASAARSANVTVGTMKQHLKAIKLKGNGMRGYIFRYADNPTINISKKGKRIIEFPELSNGKLVIDLNTGVFYYSVCDLSEITGLRKKWLYKRLCNEVPNTTQYRYA
jgi:hypothetical protein